MRTSTRLLAVLILLGLWGAACRPVPAQTPPFLPDTPIPATAPASPAASPSSRPAHTPQTSGQAALLSDLRLRQAIAHCTDRAALARAVYP